MTRFRRRRFLGFVAAGCATLAGCSSGDGGDGSGSDGDGGSDGDSGGDGGTGDRTATATATQTGSSPESSEESTPTATETADPVSVESGTIDAGSVPAYASIVPDFDGPVALTAYDTKMDLPAEMDSPGGIDVTGEWPEPSDPLRFNGLYGYQGGRVVAAGLLAVPVGLVVSENFERMEQRDVTPQYVTLNGVGLVYGSYAFDDAVASLREEGLTEIEVGSDRAYFRTEAGAAVGLTSEVVAFDVSGDQSVSFDPLARIRDVVRTAVGERPAKVDTDDGFARLLWNAGDRNTTSVAYAPEQGLDAYLDETTNTTFVYDAAISGFESATGAAFGADLTPDGSKPSTTGYISYPAGDAVDENALTANLGTAATARTFVRDAELVRASGTYEWPAFEQFLS